jgi:legumain
VIPEGDHWAVIVTGSKDMWNYRHQAGACRAYQILKKYHIPEDQIIQFSFDDAVRDRENPFRGKLFYEPNGEDVYEGCKIDYRGKDVTTANFLGAITASDQLIESGFKVLKSNDKSKVFMYIANHGGTGLLAFPNDEFLYADEFTEALQSMKKKGLFGEMLIYLEGSNSGSMFADILPEDINVLAVTAGTPQETTFGSNCYPFDQIKGENLGVCLSDPFSFHWMKDSESQCPVMETIETQLKHVDRGIQKTNVTIYGDKEILQRKFGEFIGNFKPKDLIQMPSNFLPVTNNDSPI